MLKNSTLFRKDDKMSFEGYDQWGSEIELKPEQKWKFVDGKWVAEESERLHIV